MEKTESKRILDVQEKRKDTAISFTSLYERLQLNYSIAPPSVYRTLMSH